MRSRRLLLVFPVMLALAATACGSSKNTTASAGGSTATTTTLATAAVPAPTTTAPSGSSAATVSTGSTAIGTVLVNSAGHTLYHFDRDTASSFGCTGGCLSAWPPLTVSSGNPVAGPGVSGTLGVRARPDGSQQVTWNGMPLYTFASDQAPGDTKGDGLGGLWHAAKLSAAGAGSGSGPSTTASYGSY